MSRGKSQALEDFLADRLKWFREKIVHVETQWEMADLAGISPNVYSNLETNRTELSVSDLLRILMVCPDKDIRDRFLLDIAERGSKIRFTPGPEVPIEAEEGAQPGAMTSDRRVISPHSKPRPKKR